jgi:radical SAM protein
MIASPEFTPVAPRRPDTVVRAIERHDFDDSPQIVFYELTRACDLTCLHCRACAQPWADPLELPTEHSRRLLAQIAEFSPRPLLVLTGGDPLKRADLFDLIEYGISIGLEISITPSATPLVTREVVARLRSTGVSRLAVSLDGPDAASHDAVRGVAGSFARTLEIIADARWYGLPVQVNTTLTPDNFQHIDRFACLLSGFDIVMWSVFFLVPTGRAAGQRCLNADQCEAAFESLWRQSNSRTFRIKTTEAPHYRRFVAQRLRKSRIDKPDSEAGAGAVVPPSPRFLPTNDGKGIMFISHTGAIQPSGFLPLHCGQFPEDHPVSVYRNSPIFRALRDTNRLQSKCGDCEYRNVCGGSRARAFAVTGNAFAEEPDCVYLPTLGTSPRGRHARSRV